MKLRSKLEFTFEVLIESLSDVPRLQGSIQCKLRLLSSGAGGGFLLNRTRLNDERKIITEATKIENHQAQFNSKHTFVVAMTTDNKFVLKSQIMRVSVRLIDTNNSQKKLGYSDIDLAELSPGENMRKPLLRGYRRKERQDNSRIIMKITMTLTKGDPMSFIPAGSEYNSMNGQRNVIKDILNPIPPSTAATQLEPSTLHSQIGAAPSEGVSHHSRTSSAQVDLDLQQQQLSSTGPAALGDQRFLNSVGTSSHTRTASHCLLSVDNRQSSLNNLHFRPRPASVIAASTTPTPNNLTVGGFNPNRLSCASNLDTYCTLPQPISANQSGVVGLTSVEMTSSSTSSLNRRRHNSSSTLNQGDPNSSSVSGGRESRPQLNTSRRLGGVMEAADSSDSLASTRLDNRALVNSLFDDLPASTNPSKPQIPPPSPSPSNICT